MVRNIIDTEYAEFFKQLKSLRRLLGSYTDFDFLQQSAEEFIEHLCILVNGLKRGS
jgi:hypothetical protein